MSYYRECPYCHAHLDAGERCDCGENGTQWHDERPEDDNPGLDDIDDQYDPTMMGADGYDENSTDG